MARGDALCADLASQGDKPLEFDFRVAEATWNGRFACPVARDKWPDHCRLELLFEVYHVVGDPQKIRHSTGIINIIKRTAAAAGVLQCVDVVPQAPQARQTALVPQLHRQPNHRGVASGPCGRLGIRIVFDEQGGRSGTVHASAHRYSNSHELWPTRSQ